jgi:AcrR family transcriptional regulator
MPAPEPSPRPAGTPRPARLAEIVAAAFHLLDTEGAGALTMRRLGDAMGMRAPSLYKHVRDKEALEAALVEDVLFDVGDELHAAVAEGGRDGAVAGVLRTYRAHGLARPNRYRLATSGRLPRELLPDGLEDWAGQPFFLAGGEPHRAQALWSLAHGMVILEIDGRYPSDSDLDRTWEAAIAAFS